MTREKKEKLYKYIEAGIYLWIQQKGYFWYFGSINYMCNDISRMCQCSPHLVKKIFWKNLMINKSFKKWLSNFEI